MELNQNQKFVDIPKNEHHDLKFWPFSPSNSNPHHNQSFKGNKTSYSDSSQKFVDHEFPPEKSSLYGQNYNSLSSFFSEPVSWVRAESISSVGSSIFDHGIHPTDLSQGGLGDCWFLASMACLANYPNLIKRIFAKSNKINKEGKYVLRLFKDGNPRDVVIDSLLPMHNFSGSFYGCTCKTGQLWAPLLEKAYAKVHGSYELLKSGECHHALQDLTGFPSGLWEDPQLSPNFWDELVHRVGDKTQLLTAAIDGKIKTHSSYKMKRKGLLVDHAYSVLQVKEYYPTKLKLIQLRNPWGKFEWKGDYNDNSEKWTYELKRYFNLSVNDYDGEFWMTFDDFKSLFDTFSYCVCRNDWQITRSPFRFEKNVDSDSLSVKSIAFRVIVPHNSVLKYAGIHQSDPRISKAKKCIDLGAYILKYPEMKCCSYIPSALDRWAQFKVDLGPGIYDILPYTSGAHFLDEKDDYRDVMLSLHGISTDSNNPPHITKLDYVPGRTNAAIVSFLDVFSEPKPRENIPYTMKMVSNGALAQFAIENHDTNECFLLKVDSSKSTNLIPAIDSWQKIGKSSFILPPGLKTPNYPNSGKQTALLGTFVRIDDNACRLGVNIDFYPVIKKEVVNLNQS